MPSLTRTLISGESVVFASGRHWVAPVRDSLLACGLVLAGLVLWAITPSGDGILGILWTLLGLLRWALLIGGAAWIAYNVVTWKTAEFAVTNLRVLRSEGLVRKRTSETMLAAVSDAKLDIGFIGSRLGYGDVRVFTLSGRAGAGAFRAITQPAEFRNAILGAKVGARVTAPAGAGPGQTPAGAAVASVAPGPPGQLPGSVRPASAALARGWSQATPQPPASPVSPAAPNRAPAAPQPPSVRPPTPAGATVERLVRLAELRDRGVISDAEFEAKKSELLARM